MKISAYIPKEFQRTFMGFPTDGTAEIRAFHEGIEARRRKDRKVTYYHRSRGKAFKQLIKELEKAITDSYMYSGIEADDAAKSIYLFLKQKGVLKYLL